eukprot:10364189-Alexandrium_andersonii.AAC.1
MLGAEDEAAGPRLSVCRLDFEREERNGTRQVVQDARQAVQDALCPAVLAKAGAVATKINEYLGRHARRLDDAPMPPPAATASRRGRRAAEDRCTWAAKDRRHCRL